MYDIGIDVGGTFTDVVMIGQDGLIQVTKGLTSGTDQSVGAAEAAARLNVPMSEARTIIHGTTVATNAILERRGAKLALVTTRGFRDVLELQRQERANIWDLYVRKVMPLVPRNLRLEIDERIRADGTVMRPIDPDDVQAVATTLSNAGVEAVAISFINAYANPAHEIEAERQLREMLPRCYVTRSSAIAPHFREYERTSTTTISSYVEPKVTNYLDRFTERFGARGFGGNIFVMGSNGGVLPLAMTGRYAATTCLSGPAGGVLAAQRLVRDKGLSNVISFDMGGTSTDVCVIAGQEAVVSTCSKIDGLPITLPMFSIETVSAGGGSISSLDPAGLLKIGPRSAGSQPGPACYGRGGTEPTVTDALCLLGLLREQSFFGGEMRLNGPAARQAFAPLAQALGDTPEGVAAKTLTLANVKMANAVRLVSVREGLDPRDFALVAFGGAGPLHACSVAKEIGITRVVVPRFPGAFSALGLLSANLRRDYLRARPARLSTLADSELQNEFQNMLHEAESEMAAIAAGRSVRWECQADLRYVGQASELIVPLPDVSRVRKNGLMRRFHAQHAAKFGYAEKDAEIELVNLRLTGFAVVDLPDLPEISGGGASPTGGLEATGLPGAEQCRFLDRSELGAGDDLEGPCVISEPTATTFLPPGWRLSVDERGHLDLFRNSQG